MGRDKLQLTVGGRPLLQRVYRVLESGCGEVLVVGFGDAGPGELRGLEARWVSDLRPGRAGPLAGIEAGLAAAGNDRVLVAAGDMPFLSKELAGYMLGCLRRSGVRVVVPRYGGRLHPLCAAYHREVLPDLSFALNLGVRAAHTFLENLDGVRYVEEELPNFGDPDLFLMNVNSPEDLAHARRAARSEES